MATDPTRPRSPLWRHAIGVIILLLFVWLVESVLGWGEVLRPWSTQSIPVIVTAVALALLSLVLRTLRLIDYFRDRLAGQFPTCLRLMIQHNLFNNLLPMRTGEISFPILMSRYFDVPAVVSVPGLLWFRVLDLHVVLALGLTALAAWWWSVATAMVLFVFWLPLPLLLWRLKRTLQRHLDGSGGRWQNLLAQLLSNLPEDTASVLRTGAWTWINWLVKLAVYAWIITVFCPAPIAAALTGAVSGELTSVLPIHGVAGTGTYEAGVTGGLMLFGLEAEAALQGAVNLHLFILATTLISGALSFMLPGRANSLQ